MATHRTFYPTAKPGEHVQTVQPLVRADPIVTSEGISLEFLATRRDLTPAGCKMLARWLFAIAHEAIELAEAGLIQDGSGYNIETGKPVSNDEVKDIRARRTAGSRPART